MPGGMGLNTMLEDLFSRHLPKPLATFSLTPISSSSAPHSTPAAVAWEPNGFREKVREELEEVGAAGSGSCWPTGSTVAVNLTTSFKAD